MQPAGCMPPDRLAGIGISNGASLTVDRKVTRDTRRLSLRAYAGHQRPKATLFL